MRLAWIFLAPAALLATGCQHHRASNQYAYAPPYAPPVYPQPASFSTAPGTAVAPGMAAPVVAGAPAVAPGGALAATPCPPATTTAVQTSPCPPGEYIVGGSLVSGAMPGDETGGVIVADGQTPPCPPGP